MKDCKFAILVIKDFVWNTTWLGMKDHTCKTLSVMPVRKVLLRDRDLLHKRDCMLEKTCMLMFVKNALFVMHSLLSMNDIIVKHERLHTAERPKACSVLKLCLEMASCQTWNKDTSKSFCSMSQNRYPESYLDETRDCTLGKAPTCSICPSS